MGRRSKYPEEFRQRAAQLVLDSRRSVRDVAGELGVNHETLRNWVAAERRQRAEGPAALSADERFELTRLRRKVAELELEREILKSRGLLRPGDGPVNRGLVCKFIAAEKTSYGVRRLRRVFGISPTSFYAWAARRGDPTAAELDDAYAIEAARVAWEEHRRIYGARWLTAEVRDRGHAWNRKRVARLMRAGGIEGVHRRRRGKYGRRAAPTATALDLVERNFTVLGGGGGRCLQARTPGRDGR